MKRQVAESLDEDQESGGTNFLGRTENDSRGGRGKDFGGAPSVPSPSAHLVGVRGVGVRRPGIPGKADVNPVAVDRNPKRFGGKDDFKARRSTTFAAFARATIAEPAIQTFRENRRGFEWRSCAGIVPNTTNMSNENPPSGPAVSPLKRKGPSTAQVLVVSSVMFTFISYWRTAAIVLCDLASTAYYIGGIVESQIGKAAPWFILAVMIFSYGVRSVYIESCSMFVRGGVYRVVKEAMGGSLAKLSVSALLFDYVLTGPISAVTAGQYIIGWIVAFFQLNPKTSFLSIHINEISAAIAVAVTIYFWRVNVRGIHESSDKALKIMGATTVMGVTMIIWCLATLAVHTDKAWLPP